MNQINFTTMKSIFFTLSLFLFFGSCSMNTIFKLEKNPDPTLNNTCTISGYVFDRKTKKPLIGANVLLVGTAYGVASLKDGDFSMKNIPPGKYEMKISYIGYKPYSKSDIVFEANYRYLINVELFL